MQEEEGVEVDVQKYFVYNVLCTRNSRYVKSPPRYSTRNNDFFRHRQLYEMLVRLLIGI